MYVAGVVESRRVLQDRLDLIHQRSRLLEQGEGILELLPVDGADGTGGPADDLAASFERALAGIVRRFEATAQPRRYAFVRFQKTIPSILPSKDYVKPAMVKLND